MSKITFPGGNGGGGGGGVSDHGGLAGLGDDDHAQYLLRSDFATSGAELDHGALQGKGDDDHTQYLLRSDFATSGAQLDHGALQGKGDDDHTQYLLVDGSRNQTSLVIDTTLAVSGATTVDGNVLPLTSGGADLGSSAQRFNEVHAKSGYFGSATTSIGDDILSSGYVDGVELRENGTAISTVYESKSSLSASGFLTAATAGSLLTNGANRMEAPINGPYSGPLTFQGAANASGDMSDDFNDGTVAPKWIEIENNNAVVTESTGTFIMDYTADNFQMSAGLYSEGVFDLDEDIDIQMRWESVDNESDNMNFATLALGIPGNAPGGAGFFRPGVGLDQDAQAMGIQLVEAGTWNVRAQAFVKGTATLGTNILGSLSDIEGSGGVDVRLTWSAGDNEVNMYCKIADAEDWTLIWTSGITPLSADPELIIGSYHHTTAGTPPVVRFDSVAQNSGELTLNTSGTSTEFAFDTDTPGISSGTYMRFKNNNTQIAAMMPDGSIESSGFFRGSGIVIGDDFLDVDSARQLIFDGSDLIVKDGIGAATANFRVNTLIANSQIRFDTLANFQSSDAQTIEVSGASNADAEIVAASGRFNVASGIHVGAESQMWISGIPVGDYLGGGGGNPVDSRAATGDITVDTSGAYNLGELNAPFNSGFFNRVVVYAPNGSGWYIDVDNDGVLQTTGPYQP